MDGHLSTPSGSSPPAAGLATNSVVSGELASGLGAFQVLIRLQYLRTELRTWMGHGAASNSYGEPAEDLLWALQGMAAAARASRLDSYARMCLEVAAQLEPLRCNKRIDSGSLELLCAWVGSADRYLRHPCSPAAVANFVACFSALVWGGPSPPAHNNLFGELLQSA